MPLKSVERFLGVLRGITSCEIAGLAKGESDGDTYSLDLASVRREWTYRYDVENGTRSLPRLVDSCKLFSILGF